MRIQRAVTAHVHVTVYERVSTRCDSQGTVSTRNKLPFMLTRLRILSYRDSKSPSISNSTDLSKLEAPMTYKIYKGENTLSHKIHYNLQCFVYCVP